MVLASAAAPLWAVVAPRPPASAPRAVVVDPRVITLQRERLNPPVSALAPYVVPNVVNQPLAQALSTLNQQGFKTEAQSADGSTAGERVVVSTRPPAGARGPITQRPVVAVFHRAAPAAPQRTMPDLTNKSCDDAASALARLNLRLETCQIGAATARVPPGRIHTQTPLPGAQLPEDRQVRAVVEPQPDTHVTVPNVVNQPLAQALATLNQQGFKTDAQSADVSTAGERVVVSTRPPAGARVPATQRPVVTVLHRAVPGAPLRTVPDITNKSCDDATIALARLNLRLEACQIGAATARVPPGRIHTQTPLPGAPLPADRQVRAVVEPQPDMRVAVPDVRERTAVDAQRVLREAQLEPMGVAPAQNNAWHVVRDQKPRAPVRVERGSRVQLELEGRFVVPALRELSCEAAQSAARQRGFAQLSCHDEDSGAASGQGRVFRQSVEAGTVLAAPQALQVSIHRPAPAVVPDVRGQPIAQARERIRQAQLTARASGPQAAQGVRVGAQAPSGGSTAARGSTVALTTVLTVPDLKGLNCTDASARARAHGLSRLHCEEGTPEVAPSDAGALRTGAVFSQKPPAGEPLAAPTPLVAYLVAPALVPDVQGQPLPTAQQAIAQAGLRALADDSAAAVAAADREVVSQSPAPGTRVDRSSEVRLQTVALVLVPELTGRACDEAQRELAARSLTLNCAVVNASRFTWTAPVVESQDVAAGARVRAGHRINAQARAPVPWLALLLVGGTLTLGALAYKPIVARLRPGPKAPVPPPVAAPPLSLRGERDATPTITLRQPDESTVGGPPLGLRVEGGHERLFVRGLGKSDGFDDGGPDGTNHG